MYDGAPGATNQRAKLIPPNGAAYDEFGSAIAAATDRLVVGAPNATVATKLNQGAAYVFARNATGWAEAGKLVATDGSAFDNLGTSVAVWGDRAVAGAPLADPGSTDLGAVYVFAKGASWAQEAKLVVTGGAPGDQAGRVMAGSSNLLLTSGVTATIGANAETQDVRS